MSLKATPYSIMEWVSTDK